MSLGYGKCIILQLKDYEVRSLIWLNKLSFSQWSCSFKNKSPILWWITVLNFIVLWHLLKYLLETHYFFPSIPNRQFRAKSTTDLPLTGDADTQQGNVLGLFWKQESVLFQCLSHKLKTLKCSHGTWNVCQHTAPEPNTSSNSLVWPHAPSSSSLTNSSSSKNHSHTAGPWPLEGLSHFISAPAGSGSTQLKQVVAMPKKSSFTHCSLQYKIKPIELLSRLHCGWMTGILHLITCLLTKTSAWWKPALNCLLAFNLEAKDKTLKNHLIITESERKKWSIWRNFYVIWGKILQFKIFTWTYFFSKSLNVEVICRKSGNGQKRHIHLNNKLYTYS